MQLKKKKKLIARTLGVGTDRITLEESKLTDIKEAITRQDIRDLIAAGAIRLKPIKGRKSKETRKTKKRVGKRRKRVKETKEDYMALTRKLRAYLKNLRANNKITKEEYYDLRRKVKSKVFKSLSNFKEITKK
jgi:large subunit ribosomal protein L19e